MSLVACRACGHQVDTSALACPNCGATDPGKKISRQRRDARNFVIQLVFWICLVFGSSWYVWNSLIPAVKQYLVKPPADQPPAGRP